MIISESGPYQLEMHLTWEDWERLIDGHAVGGRYDGENKMELGMFHPLDGEWDPRTADIQRPCAEFDRVTSDIHVFIPQSVIMDARTKASILSQPGCNLVIYPEEADPGPWDDMVIRVVYPV